MLFFFLYSSTELFWAGPSITHAPCEHLTKRKTKHNLSIWPSFVEFYKLPVDSSHNYATYDFVSVYPRQRFIDPLRLANLLFGPNF
jgi:hypothetical protein